MLLDNDDADSVDAFLGNLTGASKESTKAATEVPEGSPKAPEGSNTGGRPEGVHEAPEAKEGAHEESEAPEDAEEGSEDPDDAEVEITTGEKTEKARLRDLKDAFRKSAETAQARQEADTRRQAAEAHHTLATTALNKLLERAKTDLEPFNRLDYVVLSKELGTDDLTQLRQMHQKALENVKYLETELDGAVRNAQTIRAEDFKRAAQACVAALKDPTNGIPNFGPEVYKDVYAHAAQRGVPPALLNELTDPAAWKIIHDAMMYQRGKQTAQEKAAKVINKPTNVLKPGSGKAPQSGANKALQALRKSGSPDDAVAAFLANIGGSSESE